jgi:Kef-type K+ transport system membrane component KefB
MESVRLGILLVLGIGVFGGILGAWIFQRLRVPQVVGYITVGLVIGQSGFDLISEEHIQSLTPLNSVALGIIGFLVGGELQLETFRKYARQFSAILLGEGIAAALLVGVPCTLFLESVLHDWPSSIAVGVVLGAIASATDPASTVDVLWESRSRGILTTSIIAIVALDDALAMTLYGLGTGAAESIARGDGSMFRALFQVGLELGGTIAIGGISGLLLDWILKRIREPEKSLAMATSFILLSIGIATALGLDVILATMILGFVVVNKAPRRSKELFAVLRQFSTPIYVIFFVLVGARLVVADMPPWLWSIVGLYVVGRSVGKLGGSYLGAKLTGSHGSVQRYLGMGLLAQGGVAVGLAIASGQRLAHITVSSGLTLGDVVVFSVTATTIIVQIIGPPMVKLGVKLAGEAGRNVTEEDVVGSWKVADAMERYPVALRRNWTIEKAMRIFSEFNQSSFPVTSDTEAVVGTLSLEDIKGVLVNQSSWEWLLVADVAAPVRKLLKPDMALSDAIAYMHEMRLQMAPVACAEDETTLLGTLSMRHLQNSISHEVIKRQGTL